MNAWKMAFIYYCKEQSPFCMRWNFYNMSCHKRCHISRSHIWWAWYWYLQLVTFLRTFDARNLDVCASHQGIYFFYCFVIMIKHQRIEEVDVITYRFMKWKNCSLPFYIMPSYWFVFGISSTDVKLHESHLKAWWGIMHSKCVYLCTLQSDFHKGRILCFLFHLIGMAPHHK